MNQLRTVSIKRGPKGYGFNLAEQFPCYLSAVHDGGVAEKQGLLVGDRLLAVNGADVTKVSHKNIVNLIANSPNDELILTVTSPPAAASNKTFAATTETLITSSDTDSDNEVWRRQKMHLIKRLKRRAAAGSANNCGKCCAVNPTETQTEQTKRHKHVNRNVHFKITKSGIAPRSKSASGRQTLQHHNHHHHQQQQCYRGSLYHCNVNTATMPSKSCRKLCCRKSTNAMNRSRSEPDFTKSSKKSNRNHHHHAHQASMIVHPGESESESYSSDDSNDDDEIDSTISSCSQSKDKNTADSRQGLLSRVVLVYIGAVPVPHLQMSRRHVVRSALQSLRAQNVRAHTVLLEIFSNRIVVTNARAVVVNRFNTDCIAFIAACVENKQFFGITTVHNDSNNNTSSASNSTENDGQSKNGEKNNPELGRASTAAVCHVFAVDPELHLHALHSNYAKRFGIRCSRDAETKLCSEFPSISGPILYTLSYVVRSTAQQQQQQQTTTPTTPTERRLSSTLLKNHSHVHRQTAGYHSSNSDSGIGRDGRDDAESVVPKFDPCHPNTGRAALRNLNYRADNNSGDLSRSSSATDQSWSLGSLRTSTTGSCGAEERCSRFSGNLKVRFDEAANSVINNDDDDKSSVSISNNNKVNHSNVRAVTADTSTTALGDEKLLIGGQSLSSPATQNTTSTSISRLIADGGRRVVGTEIDDNQVSKNNAYYGPSSGDKNACNRHRQNHRNKESSSPASNKDVKGAIIISKKFQSDLDLLVDSSPTTSTPNSDVCQQNQIGSSDLLTSSYPKRSSSSHSNNNRQRRQLYCSSSVNDVSQFPDTAGDLSYYCDGADIDVDHHFAVPAAPVAKSASVECSSPIGGQQHSLLKSYDSCENNANGYSNLSINSASSANNNNGISNQNSTTKQQQHGSLLKRLTRVDMRLSVRMKQAKKERLEVWANDFDKLLHDAAGLHAFSEFLRKQYSQENVNFWIACENFKVVEDAERAKTAMELYEHYFASGCMEPVNVDSTARQNIHDLIGAQKFTSIMFDAAQYQIFHLMKYDCYPRFLKSDEYHSCWEMADKGQLLPELREPFLKCPVNPISTSTVSLNASKSSIKDDDKNKRRSILPWKGKFGVRKKKQESLEQATPPSEIDLQDHQQQNVSVSSLLISSVGSKRKQVWRSSKHLSTPAEAFHTLHKPLPSSTHTSPTRPASSVATNRPPDVVPQPDPPSSPSPGAQTYLDTEASTSQACCTVILPTDERVALSLPATEKLTVGEWLHEVAVRFGLNANPDAISVTDVDSEQVINFASSACNSLLGKTIRVEGGVLFTIDIPFNDAKSGDRKKGHIKVNVKAQANSTSAQALRPVLNKYGILLDNMVITIDGTNEVLPNHAPIIQVNGKELILRTQEEFQEWVHREHDSRIALTKAKNATNNLLINSRQSNISSDVLHSKMKSDPELLSCNKKYGSTDALNDVFVKPNPPLPNGHKGGGMLKFVKKQEHRLTDRKSSASVKGVKASSAAISAAVARSRKSTNSLSRDEIIERARDEKKLVELLSRAQASSFDDQRCSGVKNFELPDFLKPQTIAAGHKNFLSVDDCGLLHNRRDSTDRRSSRPTDLVHRKLMLPAAEQLNGGCAIDDDKVSLLYETFAQDDTLIIPSHDEAERLFNFTGIGGDQLDFCDPASTERRSLSDFGICSTPKNVNDNNIRGVAAVDSANISVVSVGTAEDSKQRPPPPPYRSSPTVRGSLTKSAAIYAGDSRSSSVDNCIDEDSVFRFAASKRKGLYVDEEDWQVDYV